MEDNIRIRYYRSPVTNLPKGTLVTYKDRNGLVWFGIAKCAPTDSFDRTIGKFIALERLKFANWLHLCGDLKEEENNSLTFTRPNGLSGVCKEDQIRSLLDHFREKCSENTFQKEAV